MLSNLQSAYRGVLALLLVFTLGAISTIAPWLIASVYARPLLLVLWIAFTVFVTRGILPRKTLSGQLVFSMFHALVFLAFYTILWSVDPVGTLVMASSLAGLVFVVQRLSTRRWRSQSVMEQDFRLIFVISSLVLAAGLFVHFVGIFPTTLGGRYRGIINNPNMAAMVSVPVLFIGWGLFWERRKVWDFVWLLPSAITIVLTQSRTALLAVSIAVVWLLIRSGWKGVKNAALLGLIVFVGISTIGTGPLSIVFERFNQESGDDQLSGRTFIWADAMRLIRDQPSGYGWGATRAVGERFDTNLSFHNSYLETAIQGGIIALLLVAAIYFFLLVPLFRTPVNGLAAGLSGAVVAGFVIQFTESSIFGVGQPYPYIYWMCVGGLLALYANKEKNVSGSLASSVENPVLMRGEGFSKAP